MPNEVMSSALRDSSSHVHVFGETAYGYVCVNYTSKATSKSVQLLMNLTIGWQKNF
jgi:ketosteroid isomerase-like protein